MLTVQAQLPKVTLKDINGKAVSTDTLSNGGQPFIIDFFATWCKPCNRELDAISEVYEEWQQETGVKIIAVSIDQACAGRRRPRRHRLQASGLYRRC